MALKVLIIGAGFGGLAAARRLSRPAVRDDLEVTVVERTNHHLFQPLLYQVATAGLNPQDIAHSVRGLVRSRRKVAVRMGLVAGVDWEGRQVRLDDGSALPYDRLIVAAGAVTHDFGVPGVARHAFPLKELGDAVGLRNHVLSLFEHASADPSAVDGGALTFAIAGGGPTGVELAGAMSELVCSVLRRDFPRLDTGRARVVLIEREPALLGPFSEGSQRYAVDRLRRMGVDVRLGTTIAEVTADEVRFADGDRLPARTVVWAAGVRPNPLASALGVELTPRGRIAVGDGLRLPAHPEAFAIGDLAAATADGGQELPQLAPVAMQQGRHVADEIVRELHDEPARAFRYRDKGVMATIGRNAAVAELPLRVRLTGFVAWAAWLWLHLVFLVGFRNRASVLLNWAWNYVTADRGTRAVFEARYPDGDGRGRDTELVRYVARR